MEGLTIIMTILFIFFKFILTVGEREWILVQVKKEWKLSTGIVQARTDSDFD